eukprot:jgi/Hompol1/5384/HPOL_004408-RA
MEWGSLEIGALIFTIILLIMLVGKTGSILYNGVKTTFQKTWLSTLILMTVRIVPKYVVLGLQILICITSIAQVMVAAASFQPLSDSMSTIIIAQNAWLILIAVITLAQPILLMRFIHTVRDVSWRRKAPFYASLVAATAFLIIGNVIPQTDNYSSFVIGDLCVWAFALFAIMSLEAAAICQASSKPKSSDDSKKKPSSRKKSSADHKPSSTTAVSGSSQQHLTKGRDGSGNAKSATDLTESSANNSVTVA